MGVLGDDDGAPAVAEDEVEEVDGAAVERHDAGTRQLAAIEQQRVQPELAQDDWAGGATAAADGLEDAVGGGSGGTPAEGGGGFGGILIFVVIAAIIGVVIWLIVRSRRKRKGGVAGGSTNAQVEAQLPTDELVRRAGSALVQTDDAVKTSEQELGFAKAQCCASCP